MKEKRLVAVLLFILITFCYIFKTILQNRFVIDNRTGQVIKEVQVVICGQKYTLYNIPNGSKAEKSFKISGDSGYWIKAKLKDGRIIEGDGGYVTRGNYGLYDRIIIDNMWHVEVKQNGRP